MFASGTAFPARKGQVMSRSLRDELASLRIERGESTVYRAEPARGPRRSPGGATLRLLGLVMWLIPLSLVAGGGYYAYSQYDKIRTKPTVSVGLVRSMTVGEAEKLLSAKGYIKSRHQAMIGAKAPGRVEAMLVEEGTKVKKGQTLAVLEHNDTKALLESREAMIDRSVAELTEAQADFEVKDRKAKRFSELLRRQTATVDETEQVLSARDMARAKVLALQAAIKLQRAMLHETQENIANMHILAPFDGTIVNKSAEVGETITPGGMGAASGRGSVATLADLSLLEVETDIAENLLSRVAIGQPAEISVSAVPGRHYRGRLRRIIPMGDRTRGTVKVNVEVLDPDDQLFPDLVATVHFLPDKSLNDPDAGKAYLFVPKDAVIEEKGHAFAWVVDARGSLSRRLIEVVVSTDDLARVEKGLIAGEQVVLKPPKTLHVGESVRMAE